MKFRLQDIFGIDARSLAVFRIGLALTIIFDLIDRFRDLTAFYTDAGVMPREWVVGHYSLFWRLFSVHLWGGSFYFQALLFALAFIAAVALLLGYRTRLATIISWVLAVSVLVRNPMIAYGADSLTRVLLFWAMFLPLGSYWSIDAPIEAKQRESGSESTLKAARVFSAASFALILQVLLLYWFSSILKNGPEWQNGTALYYALSDNIHGSVLGRYLLGFPALIPIFTYGVKWFELLGTFLFLAPISYGLLRTVGVVLFSVLQVGIFLGLNVGLLPLVSLVGGLIFLPPWFWNKFSRKESRAEIILSRPVNIVIGILVVLVILINLSSVFPVLGRAGSNIVSDILHLNQRWAPFAPRPPLVNKWYEIPAELGTGKKINLYTEILPYTNKRWINFFESVNSEGFENYPLSYLGDYLCREWRARNGTGIESLKMIISTQKIPFYGEKGKITSSDILRHNCSE